MNGHCAKFTRSVTANVLGSTAIASYRVGNPRLFSFTNHAAPSADGGVMTIGARRPARVAVLSTAVKSDGVIVGGASTIALPPW